MIVDEAREEQPSSQIDDLRFITRESQCLTGTSHEDDAVAVHHDGFGCRTIRIDGMDAGIDETFHAMDSGRLRLRHM